MSEVQVQVQSPFPLDAKNQCPNHRVSYQPPNYCVYKPRQSPYQDYKFYPPYHIISTLDWLPDSRPFRGFINNVF